MCVCVCDACGTILLLLFLTWQRGGQRTAFHHHNNHSRPVPIRHAWHFSFFMCPVQQSLNPSIPLPFHSHPIPIPICHIIKHNHYEECVMLPTHSTRCNYCEYPSVEFTIHIQTYVHMYIPYTIYDILCVVYTL